MWTCCIMCALFFHFLLLFKSHIVLILGFKLSQLKHCGVTLINGKYIKHVGHSAVNYTAPWSCNCTTGLAGENPLFLTFGEHLLQHQALSYINVIMQKGNCTEVNKSLLVIVVNDLFRYFWRIWQFWRRPHRCRQKKRLSL